MSSAPTTLDVDALHVATGVDAAAARGALARAAMRFERASIEELLAVLDGNRGVRTGAIAPDGASVHRTDGVLGEERASQPIEPAPQSASARVARPDSSRDDAVPPAAATGGHATGGLEGLFDDLQLDLGTAESATASDSLDDLGGGTRIVPAAPVAEPDLRAALGLDDDEEELEASERTAIFDPATLAAIEAEAARPSPLLGEPESAGAWGTDSDVAGSHAAGGDAGHSAWEAEAGTTADAETVVADEDIELLEDDAVEELPADGTTVSSEAAVDGASTEEQPTAAPPSQPPPEGPAGGFFRKIFGPRR